MVGRTHIASPGEKCRKNAQQRLRDPSPGAPRFPTAAEHPDECHERGIAGSRVEPRNARFNERAGLLALALSVVYLPFATANSYLLVEVLFMTLLVATVYLYEQWLDTRTWLNAAATGVHRTARRSPR